MQTKIAFFDIDGTLIDMQSKRITEKTLEALQRLRAGGVKICLATGRSPVALPVFPGVEFDAYLTFNGSLCYRQAARRFSAIRSRMRMCRKSLPTAQPSGGLSVCRCVTGWPPTARMWT